MERIQPATGLRKQEKQSLKQDLKEGNAFKAGTPDNPGGVWKQEHPLGLELGHVAGKLGDAAVKMSWCSMGGRGEEEAAGGGF